MAQRDQTLALLCSSILSMLVMMVQPGFRGVCFCYGTDKHSVVAPSSHSQSRPPMAWSFVVLPGRHWNIAEEIQWDAAANYLSIWGPNKLHLDWQICQRAEATAVWPGQAAQIWRHRGFVSRARPTLKWNWFNYWCFLWTNCLVRLTGKDCSVFAEDSLRTWVEVLQSWFIAPCTSRTPDEQARNGIPMLG